MFYDTGRCLGSLATPNKLRERTLDPLWHMLLHERGGHKEVDIPGNGRKLLVTLSEHYSEEYHWRYIGPRSPPSESLWRWVEGTEYAKYWLSSPRALRAPSYWPEEVEVMFGVHVPEPWEVANAVPFCFPYKRENPEWYGHDVSTLISFCCGLTIWEISKICDINERAVLSHMQSGARKLMSIPRFKLWAMNLDWSKIANIALQGESREMRSRFMKDIQNNPLGLKKRDVDKAMRSIVFKYGVESSLTPKRIEHRPIHKHVIICEPR